MDKKLSKIEFIIIAVCVALFLIIGIFWNIDRRKRTFERWKKKIGEIRALRRKLYKLYSIKTKCDKRARMALFIGRTWLVVVVLVGAQWLHWEYDHVWYVALAYSFGTVGIIYKGIIFWWFAGKYGFAEAMICLENNVQCIVYRANDLDPAMIKIIEEKIEKLEQEAMILKLELRPEAQVV